METPERAARKSFIVVINMIAWMILITATGLGTTHFHECPVQPNLPIYITVIGATGLFSLLLMYLRNTLDDCLLARFCSAFSLMLCVFIVCWFFAGTYWIYSIYPPNYDSTSTGIHCHRTLYLFAFWFNNICFLCMSILFVFCLYTILNNCTIVFFTDRAVC
ncbi:transmembrane protein 272-like [Megalobrama amblycephala]|uniref:transmembrane protein 272-like n=1 Tax=Megalobrama amblycephala TaxID=75352 RepID=UPI0020144418|nr:transmembrane protein 272-like [Megalobrama amblycephala]